MATELIAVILVLLVAFIGAIASLFFKLGSAKLSKNLIKIIKNKEIIIALSLYIITIPIYVIALKKGDLSLLYPVISTTYIWVSLLSMYFLKEKMNKYKWLGIFLIISGVILIGVGSK